MSLLAQARQLLKETEETRELPLPASPAELNDIIGYSPRKLQAELDARDRRFNIRVLHRRFGKTVREVAKLVRKAMWCPFPDGRYAYLAPTYSMAEDIAWAYLEKFSAKLYGHLGLEARNWVDKSDLAVWVPTHNGSKSRIRLYGVDSPKQRLRGLYLDGVVFDEFAEQPFSVWTEQVRPMLADDVRQGLDEFGDPNQWSDFIFTPKGRNHAYTMFRRAEQWEAGKGVIVVDPDTQEEREVMRNDWSAAIYKASETGILSKREMTDMLEDMGKAKYEQEVECSFDAAIEGAIFAKDIEDVRNAGGVKRAPYNPLLPVDTAWDLGYDDATAIWFIQETAEGPVIIDYYEASGANLDHYAGILADRNYRYGRNYLPHDVDQFHLGMEKDRRAILSGLGVRVTAVPKTSKWDQIAAAQALLPRCVFDEKKTAEGLDRLALYRREKNERLGTLKQNPVHDWTSHAADAFMTYAIGRRQFRKPGSGNPNNQRSAEL